MQDLKLDINVLTDTVAPSLPDGSDMFSPMFLLLHIIFATISWPDHVIDDSWQNLMTPQVLCLLSNQGYNVYHNCVAYYNLWQSQCCQPAIPTYDRPKA